jgi:hypothetical protein
MSLESWQYRALNVTERVCSVISLSSASFVIASFVASHRFRTPINRLIFYASWGNFLIDAATLIGTSGISHGVNSSLCQLQAFTFQWFVIQDSTLVFGVLF